MEHWGYWSGETCPYTGLCECPGDGKVGLGTTLTEGRIYCWDHKRAVPNISAMPVLAPGPDWYRPNYVKIWCPDSKLDYLKK